MEKCVIFSRLTILFIVLLSMASILRVSGQIVTACTSSMITSFTPCLNYITGSSGNGSSPTADCCGSIGSLASNAGGCLCLLLTANVPFQLPINRTLSISLPRVCHFPRVALQCKASIAPLPAPGPISFGPALPPKAAVPEAASEAEAPVAFAPPPVEVASPPVVAEIPANRGGVRPVVTPSLATKLSHIYPLPLLLLGVGVIVLF